MKKITQETLETMLEEHKLWLSDRSMGKRFDESDLSYLEIALEGANLEGADLTGANLGGADLTGINLKGANLESADLYRANLNGADLRNADLRNADLRYADLENANLEDANLEGADLNFAVLDGANLNGARLEGANLQGANLQGANLQGAHLKSADLEDTDLTGANLKGTIFLKANLHKANLKDTNLNGASLENANLGSANFTNTNLEGANLNRANFYGANFTLANLEGAILTRDLTGANFTRANLEGANLYKANFYGANFEGANLGNADIRDANIEGVNLRYANLKGADLTDADLERADLEGADLERANLSGAKLEKANLQRANLEGTILKGTILDLSTEPVRAYGRTRKAAREVQQVTHEMKLSAFKKAFPNAFEAIKHDIKSGTLSPESSKALIDRYGMTWQVSYTVWKCTLQRLSPRPNDVIRMNIDIPLITDNESIIDTLDVIRKISYRSEHPVHFKGPFTVGWIRYSSFESAILVEEIQSDLPISEAFLKSLRKKDISEERIKETLGLLQPYVDRFYFDSLSIIFDIAHSAGLSVEMLSYEQKKGSHIGEGKGRRIYEELPKKMGMKKGTSSLDFIKGSVWKISPNPVRIGSKLIVPSTWTRK